MSIWGKILGGVGGFALGGPLGAIVGLAAGHAADKVTEAVRGEIPEGASEQTKQIAFTTGVVVLGAKMAKADGVVTRDEVNAFKQVFRIPPGEIKNVGRVFNIAKKDSHGFEPYARQIATLFEDNPAVLEELLDALFHIAKADGQYHPNEKRFLEQIAEIFGFTSVDFARIEARHVHAPGDDPYSILGLSPAASDEEVKAAYRRLIREHHPDRLVAQGMPQEFIDQANDKMAAINQAYEAIEKQRGM